MCHIAFINNENSFLQPKCSQYNKRELGVLFQFSIARENEIPISDTKHVLG